MVGKWARVGSLAAAGVVVSGAFALPALAGPLPTLLATTKCANGCADLVGVYRVRPAVVELTEALGGELKLHWSSWTATGGVGSGVSIVSGMGTTTTDDIRVRASHPQGGTFVDLQIVFPNAPVENLHVNFGATAVSWVR